ncbi:MAG: PaeR7I family type II restriction endonuclease [Pirellula sp.]|jgi:hypothetical protein|nr:PaeR7I family type II restriction endonuclease [Pirellula sp.]
MTLNLVNYEKQARASVRAFWGNRETARQKQIDAGKADKGERASVTAGKNMDGFIDLVIKLVEANGLKNATIQTSKRVLTLPGFFRPTKLWDLLILNSGRLVAAFEFKSQVGPSFGNNFNNRTEEAIGTAHDFWTAYRERAFGDSPRPFVGWLMLVEDSPGSRRPVKDASPNFAIPHEFQLSSYAERYKLLCEKLVLENLYTTATVLLSPRTAVKTGKYSEMSEKTGLQTLVTTFAAHIAAEAARR